jgi:PhoPQ-activated pathogenicity-related protein
MRLRRYDVAITRSEHFTMPQFKLLFTRFLLIVVLAIAFASPAWSDDAQSVSSGGLAAYVARPDEVFGWREVSTGHIGKVEYVEYIMTSQTWRGIPWKHQLFILRPANMTHDVRHALLFVHGGRWKPEHEAERTTTELPREAALFARLATSIGAPVGVLRQVPFQPIFDRREDALIAYTFDQYMKTGESDWPLLLPMVKSAVRAMDVMQRIVHERWDASLEAFTVSGASKRGWTSWLTAAVDNRVMAVAPMVIDVLNMRAQMDHQRATWGELSDEIQDYAALDLPTQLKTERGQTLLSMVDPFSYRAQLTKPKLILLSTNDRYWPLDALKLYWSELPSPKHVLYVANQGHGLRDADRVISGLSAVHRYAAAGTSLPSSSWSFASSAKAVNIHVTTDRPTKQVLIWSARSPSQDFREAHWTSHECARKGNAYVCSTLRGEQGYTAAFAETSFQDEGNLPFSTTTTVCLAGPEKSGVAEC